MLFWRTKLVTSRPPSLMAGEKIEQRVISHHNNSAPDQLSSIDFVKSNVMTKLSNQDVLHPRRRGHTTKNAANDFTFTCCWRTWWLLLVALDTSGLHGGGGGGGGSPGTTKYSLIGVRPTHYQFQWNCIFYFVEILLYYYIIILLYYYIIDIFKGWDEYNGGIFIFFMLQ